MVTNSGHHSGSQIPNQVETNERSGNTRKHGISAHTDNERQSCEFNQEEELHQALNLIIPVENVASRLND